VLPPWRGKNTTKRDAKRLTAAVITGPDVSSVTAILSADAVNRPGGGGGDGGAAAGRVMYCSVVYCIVLYCIVVSFSTEKPLLALHMSCYAVLRSRFKCNVT